MPNPTIVKPIFSISSTFESFQNVVLWKCWVESLLVKPLKLFKSSQQQEATNLVLVLFRGVAERAEQEKNKFGIKVTFMLSGHIIMHCSDDFFHPDHKENYEFIVNST